jgi:hypothetical protein
MEKGNAMKELTFFDLVAAMRAGTELIGSFGVLKGQSGQGCFINGICREDGSGRRWILKVCAAKSGHQDVFWDESKPCPFVMG